jgi:hypothetical protein
VALAISDKNEPGAQRAMVHVVTSPCLCPQSCLMTCTVARAVHNVKKRLGNLMFNLALITIPQESCDPNHVFGWLCQ